MILMNRYIELYRYYVNYLKDKFVMKMNICSGNSEDE